MPAAVVCHVHRQNLARLSRTWSSDLTIPHSKSWSTSLCPRMMLRRSRLFSRSENARKICARFKGSNQSRHHQASHRPETNGDQVDRHVQGLGAEEPAGHWNPMLVFHNNHGHVSSLMNLLKRFRSIGFVLASGHSALMSANLTTLAHFSVSSAMSLPKSAGEPESIRPPRSASRAFILGSASAALTCLLSVSTISLGVPLGAPTPKNALAS